LYEQAVNGMKGEEKLELEEAFAFDKEVCERWAVVCGGEIRCAAR
jgi:hypothetical protein